MDAETLATSSIIQMHGTAQYQTAISILRRLSSIIFVQNGSDDTYC